MKRSLVIIFLFPFFAIAQQSGYVIKGTLSGLKDKSWVFLMNANDPTDTVASSKVMKGKFTLKGKLTEPGLYHVNFPAAAKKALLFIDNSTMSISGDVANIQQIRVDGSESHKDFEEFQRDFNPLFEKYSLIGREANLVGMTDSLGAEAEKISKDIQLKLDAFTKDKRTSYVTPFLLLVTSQLSNDMKLLESRFASLPENTRQGYYGKLVKGMIDDSKIGEVGSTAIDFIQNDTTGKPVALSSFKGKYVLVDFWASWCGPCRQENPNVVRTYEAYKDKNFTVLGVSLDRSRDPWLKAIRDDQLTWTHVSDLKFWSNAAAMKYRIQSIPQNFLIDPDGKIIARNLRGPELGSRLSELLK